MRLLRTAASVLENGGGFFKGRRCYGSGVEKSMQQRNRAGQRAVGDSDVNDANASESGRRVASMIAGAMSLCTSLPPPLVLAASASPTPSA